MSTVVETRFTRRPRPETMFAVGNGYLGVRGAPEEGAPAHDAGADPQRLPRDVADRLPRGRLRARPHRPDDGRTPRRRGDPAVRRRRAVRPRERRGSLRFERALDMRAACCAARSSARRRAAGACSCARGASCRSTTATWWRSSTRSTSLDGRRAIDDRARSWSPTGRAETADDPRRGQGLRRERARRRSPRARRRTRAVLCCAPAAATCGWPAAWTTTSTARGVVVESDRRAATARSVVVHGRPGAGRVAAADEVRRLPLGRRDRLAATSPPRRADARPGRRARLRRDRGRAHAGTSTTSGERSDVAARRRARACSRRSASTCSSCCRRPPGSRASACPAKGVTGRGYEGHYFWDTEIYVVPFLTHTARSGRGRCSSFRCEMLDAARRGPASSAIGARCSRGARSAARRPPRATRPAPPSTTSTPTSPTRCTSTSGSPATWTSCSTRRRGARRDRAVLDGARLLLRAARRAVLHQRRDRSRRVHDGRRQQHLHEPDGPGEPRDRRAGRRVAGRRRPVGHAAARRATGLHRRRGRRLAAGGRPDVRPALRRAPASSCRTRASSTASRGTSRAHRPTSYPLLLHYHPLVIYRHQVIKQADVVLATYLLGDHSATTRSGGCSTTTTR